MNNKQWEPIPDLPMKYFISYMKWLKTDDERKRLLIKVMNNFCRDCGKITEANKICQCENDE